ncbi:MAG: MoaD/ThiS family protein [Pseudomonadota bacterium]
MTRILFFGRIGEAAGCGELDVALPDGVRTLSALRAWLGARDEALGDVIHSPKIRVAVDQQFCNEDRDIAEAREIAFMSPLSGG